MRVVHPDEHPQQGGRRGHRQGHGREPGPYQDHTDGQREGQGGVVAGERPVARCGTRREDRDPWQGPARAFLVDEEFDRLTESIGDDGPGGGHDHPGQPGHPSRPGRVPAAQGAPADPGQQQAQEQQGALARRFQDGPSPRRPVRHAPGQRPVGPHREARGDVHRLVRLRHTAGRQPDHDRCPSPGRRDRHRQPSAPSTSLDRIHAADGRNTAAGAPWPKGSPVPRRSSGLTGWQAVVWVPSVSGSSARSVCRPLACCPAVRSVVKVELRSGPEGEVTAGGDRQGQAGRREAGRAEF
ncbi:hypothetical protein M2167_005435 [Streptomyces sp. SPB4]|nr:hypothetical protein [Streptomyces sp. SPB4]